MISLKKSVANELSNGGGHFYKQQLVRSYKYIAKEISKYEEILKENDENSSTTTSISVDNDNSLLSVGSKLLPHANYQPNNYKDLKPDSESDAESDAESES